MELAYEGRRVGKTWKFGSKQLLGRETRTPATCPKPEANNECETRLTMRPTRNSHPWKEIITLPSSYLYSKQLQAIPPLSRGIYLQPKQRSCSRHRQSVDECRGYGCVKQCSLGANLLDRIRALRPTCGFRPPRGHRRTFSRFRSRKAPSALNIGGLSSEILEADNAVDISEIVKSHLEGMTGSASTTLDAAPLERLLFLKT